MSVTFFRPFVDEQHDQVHLRMVHGDRLSDVLEEHRLAGARRCDDEAALSLADRRHQIHDARGHVVAAVFEPDRLLRIERRQVLEEQLLACLVRRLEVDRFDLDQREVPLTVLRWTNLSRDRVARVEIELSNL
jgi:hypothetical protein